MTNISMKTPLWAIRLSSQHPSDLEERCIDQLAQNGRADLIHKRPNRDQGICDTIDCVHLLIGGPLGLKVAIGQIERDAYAA